MDQSYARDCLPVIKRSGLNMAIYIQYDVPGANRSHVWYVSADNGKSTNNR